MEDLLPLIWAAILGFAVAMYVILDGFDLGTGILFPFAGNERQRDQMIASIKPYWDGNETWLVLGGAGASRRVPTRLRHYHAGALPADHRHAARAGVSRRHFEFRAVARRVRSGTRCSLCRRRSPHSAKASSWAASSRHQGGRRRLCGRPARLGDAVRRGMRIRRRRGLRTPGRDLAGHERRRASSASARAGWRRCCSLRCWPSWRSSACGRRWRSSALQPAGSAGRIF